MIYVDIAVEGIIDEAVVKRLIHHIGGVTGRVYGRRGKQELLNKLHGFNNAARFTPWIVLLDLNNDYKCAPLAKDKWLPDPSPFICFRIAVREIESWLLADRDRFSKFFAIAKSTIPFNPDIIQDPKQRVVELAKASRNREIRELLVPKQGSGRRIGPGYSSKLQEFVLGSGTIKKEYTWRPEIAATKSKSLEKCIDSLRNLIHDRRRQSENLSQ